MSALAKLTQPVAPPSTFDVAAVNLIATREIRLTDYGYQCGIVWEIVGTSIWIAENSSGEKHGFDGPHAKDRAFEWATNQQATPRDLYRLQDRAEEVDACPF